MQTTSLIPPALVSISSGDEFHICPHLSSHCHRLDSFWRQGRNTYGLAWPGLNRLGLARLPALSWARHMTTGAPLHVPAHPANPLFDNMLCSVTLSLSVSHPLPATLWAPSPPSPWTFPTVERVMRSQRQ